MTTIRSDGADAFVKRPPVDMRFFLVHGIDEGLIHERARALVAAVLPDASDPFSLTRMSGDDLAREPGRLEDEAYSVSMFGGRRAIWIDAGSRDLAAQIEPLLPRPPQDCVLVVEAGNLKKGVRLRVMFEQASNAASIECYPDERKSLAALIEAEARAAGLQVAPDARDYLMTLLGSDRQTTRGEVTKLMLYAAGAAKVEIADVEAIVTDAAPSSLDNLINQSLQGNLTEVGVAAGRFFNEGGDAGHMLIRLISRLMMLHSIRLEVEQGKSLDAVVQTHVFRLPPSERASLTKQAERWDAAALGKRLSAILGVVARARRETRLGDAISTRALWSLASGASANRG